MKRHLLIWILILGVLGVWYSAHRATFADPDQGSELKREKSAPSGGEGMVEGDLVPVALRGGGEGRAGRAEEGIDLERRSQSDGATEEVAGDGTEVGWSNFYFVRASEILGEGATDAVEMVVFRDSLAAVMESRPPGAIVFDVDGRSASEAHVLVYGRDRYDLTREVWAEFKDRIAGAERGVGDER